MKILIAEDDTTTRMVLNATLKKLGHEVTAVADGQQAVNAMEADHFPVLISDWMMPELDGLQLCRRLRGAARSQYTYIILLTSRGGKGSYLDGMDAGADDFVTKPFDVEQLAARLRVAERILDLHDRLRTQAMYDGLTGLLNRTAIMDQLSSEMERARREGKALSVVLLDIDHFKQVNDTHGHASGDEVLRQVARRMKDSMRGYDSVGRYGGEEFLIVAPGCGPADSLNLAERIRCCIASAPISVENGTLAVTCSLGAAVACMTRQGEEPAAVVGRADAALYRAKANGRNRSEMADAAPL